MNLTCKNCNEIYSGNYCPNCGQTSKTHKLNFHFLLHDIQHGLFHFDQGILYSAKQLFIRPGHTIREFIEGKRIKHFKPISMAVFLATIYGFLYHHFNIIFAVTKQNSPLNIRIEVINANEWIGSHFAIFTLLSIPLYTIGTSIAFRKQEYNLVEYFIFNTFKACQRLFVGIATFPLLYYFNGTATMKLLAFGISLINIILLLWTNVQFFNKLSFKKSFLLTLFSQLIFLICLLSVIIIVEVILSI